MATYFYIVGNSIQSDVDSDTLNDFGEISVPNDAQWYLIIGDRFIRELEVSGGSILCLPRFDKLSQPFSLVNRRHIEAIKSDLGYTNAQILDAFGWTDSRDETRFGDLVPSGSIRSLLNKNHYQALQTNTGLSGAQIIEKLGLTDNR